MSWSCSWMAVKGAPRGSVLHALGLKELGAETYPGSREHPFSVGELSGGWVVVFSDFGWMTDDRPATLASLGEVIACRVSEVVMVSDAWAARHGQEEWRVTHNPEADPYALETSGTPPSGFEEIRDRLMADQVAGDAENHGCDYIFDIPLETAKLACGFRMDEWEPAFSAAEFADERPARAHSWPGSRRGVLSRLFDVLLNRR